MQCVSCRLGHLKDYVCQTCGAQMCNECCRLLNPCSNIPEYNCRCREMGWHEPGRKKARKLEG